MDRRRTTGGPQIILYSLVFLLGLGVGPALGEAGETPHKGGILRVTLPTEPPTLDPHWRTASSATRDITMEALYSFNRPWSDGTTGIKLSPLELLEQLAAIMPLPRVHLVHYAGCLALHSKLRDTIIPTPRQQGVNGEEAHTGTPHWS
jgi:hypothetical protein